MALESFEKQSYEQFMIGGDFESVMETTEAITLGSCVVEAIDKDGQNVASTILDDTTKAVGDSPDGGTNNVLKIRCRAGSASASPYKITFKIVTDLGEKWELDVKMKVKEL